MKALKNIIIFVLTILVAFVGLELFIRVTHISNVSFTKFYEDIGRGRSKNMNVVYFNEGFGISWLNEYRYLGASTPPERTAGEFRIALLGDSYVEALEVFDRHHFCSIAEEKISKELNNTKVSMLNFGRRGFDIADMYAYQQNLVNNFSPDYIFYFLSSSDLEPKYNDPLRPAVIISDSNLKISSDYSEKELKIYRYTGFLIQASSILNMVNSGKKKLEEVPLGMIILDKAYNYFHSCDNSFEETMDKSNFSVNPVTDKILSNMDTSKVIIVNRDILGLPEEFLSIVKSKHIKYLDLAPSLIKAKEDNKDPNYWEVTSKRGHWNHYGHSVVGNSLSEYCIKLYKEKQY